MSLVDRPRYAALYGPTTGDRIRLADTNLFVEVEEDRCSHGDEAVFDTFVIFVGLGQLAGYAVFPLLSARMPRARLYAVVTALMVVGLVGFFFLPMDIVLLGAAAVLLFFLASVVMLLMLLFQADTIEYGQLKLGQRNGAVTFALQPFINKVSGALNTAVVGLVAYRTAFGRRQAVMGLQEETIGGRPVWVLPNPSGLNAHYKPADFARLYAEAHAYAIDLTA